jgi:hypothetical protein
LEVTAMMEVGQEVGERPGFDEGPTSYETPVNRFGVRCGMCGDLYYVNEATLAGIDTAVAAGLDNPFMCDDCREETDELAYEG